MENFDDNKNNNSLPLENINMDSNFPNKNEQFICIFKGRRRGRAAHRNCNEKCLIPFSVFKQQLIDNGDCAANQELVCKYLKNNNVPLNHTFCTPFCFKEAKYLPTSFTQSEINNVKNKAIWIIVSTILWVIFAIVAIVIGVVLSTNETAKISAIALGCVAIFIWFIKNIILFNLKKQLKIRSFSALEYENYTEPVFVTRNFSKNFKLTGLLFVPFGFSFIWQSANGFIMFFVAIVCSIVLIGYSIVSSIFYGLYTGIYLLKNAKADA